MHRVLTKKDNIMNYVTRHIMSLLKVDAETAIQVQLKMDIDFSECSKAQLNREIKMAFAMLKVSK